MKPGFSPLTSARVGRLSSQRKLARRGIEANRKMLRDELRTPRRAIVKSSFKIHPSNFGLALPRQIFYTTQISVSVVKKLGVAGR